MIRKEAMELCVDEIKNQPIISANGFISRDLFNVHDKLTNFYMIGSMGLSSSIGLGIALKKPKKRIFVFDGDGNILMNLGSLTTIGKLQPKNLIHIIFDNSISLISNSICLLPKVIFPVNEIKQPFEIIFFANSKSFE